MRVGIGDYGRAMDLLKHILQAVAERNSFYSSYGGSSGDYESRRLEIAICPPPRRTFGQWASSLFRRKKPVTIARLARWDEYSRGYVDDGGYASEHHYNALVQLTHDRAPCPSAGGPEAGTDSNDLGWLGVFGADNVQWSPFGKHKSSLFRRESMPIQGQHRPWLERLPHLLLVVFLEPVSQ
jgi:hypothetical protein